MDARLAIRCRDTSVTSPSIWYVVPHAVAAGGRELDIERAIGAGRACVGFQFGAARSTWA